jgi:hypothetical protein
MVKPVFRRKSIGTKVSEEEYARLEALAGGRAMSEWAREVLLRELDGRQARPADETLLAEVLALRTILLNLHFTVAKGEAITAEGMQAIMDRADDGWTGDVTDRFESEACYTRARKGLKPSTVTKLSQ